MNIRKQVNKCSACMAFLCCFAFLGCTAEMNERIKRGDPGSAGYIAPDYRPCKIIAFEPERIEKVVRGTAIRQAYSVIEDDRGRRYHKGGKVGEVGDEFEMDVSLSREVK